MLSSREKSPLPEAQRRFEPTTLHDAGQQAQHTTDWAIPVPHWFHCYKLSRRWPRVSESRQGKSRMSETYLAVGVREVEFRKTLATGVQQTAHSQRSIGTGKINFISSSEQFTKQSDSQALKTNYTIFASNWVRPQPLFGCRMDRRNTADESFPSYLLDLVLFLACWLMGDVYRTIHYLKLLKLVFGLLLLLFLLCSQLHLWVHHFWWDISICDHFFNQTIEVVTFRLRGCIVLKNSSDLYQHLQIT